MANIYTTSFDLTMNAHMTGYSIAKSLDKPYCKAFYEIADTHNVLARIDFEVARNNFLKRYNDFRAYSNLTARQAARAAEYTSYEDYTSEVITRFAIAQGEI